MPFPKSYKDKVQSVELPKPEEANEVEAETKQKKSRKKVDPTADMSNAGQKTLDAISSSEKTTKQRGRRKKIVDNSVGIDDAVAAEVKATKGKRTRKSKQSEQANQLDLELTSDRAVNNKSLSITDLLAKDSAPIPIVSSLTEIVQSIPDTETAPQAPNSILDVAKAIPEKKTRKRKLQTPKPSTEPVMNPTVVAPAVDEAISTVPNELGEPESKAVIEPDIDIIPHEIASPKVIEPQRRKRTPTVQRTRKPRTAKATKPVKPIIVEEPLPPPGKNRVGLVNKKPCLIIDNLCVTPLMLFGNINSHSTEEKVIAEIRRAQTVGINLMSLIIDVIVDDDALPKVFDTAVYILEKAVSVNPNIKLIWRVVFTPGKNAKDNYPEAFYTRADGTISEPSISSDRWWGAASSCLTQFIELLQAHKYADNVVGYHLERGEWFYGKEEGYDSSRAALEQFRQWVRLRYNDDIVKLRAAWHDADITFNSIEIPPYKPYPGKNDLSLYDARKDRNIIDYHLFLSDAVSERLVVLSKEVKKTSKNEALVGVSYGYTFEWSHPNSGHLGLGRLLVCSTIDYIAGPPSYSDRLPGAAGSYPCPIDSVMLRGKVFIAEEDYKTPGSNDDEPDDYNPRIQNAFLMNHIHTRGLGASMVYGSAVNWMDLWGKGWLDSDHPWRLAKRYRQWKRIQLDYPSQDPDVAVIIDERSAAHTRDRDLLQNLLFNQRSNIQRCGASVGYYLLSDLMLRNFPDCKLYIFLNAWNISNELRALIKERLQRDDKTLVWLYAMGLYQNHKPALEQAREATGAALKPQPFASQAGSLIMSKRHPITQYASDKLESNIKKLEPTFYALTEDAVVLAEYNQTGLPSISVKEYKSTQTSKSWRSVFIGEPMLPTYLLRGLCDYARVPIYNHSDDPVVIRLPYLVIHAKESGIKTITLPSKMSIYSLSSEEWLAEDAVSSIKIRMQEGETQTLIAADYEQITRMLSLDPDEKIIAPKPSPTLEFIEPAEPAPALIDEPDFFDADISYEEKTELSTETERPAPVKKRTRSANNTKKRGTQQDPEIRYRFRKKTES